MYPSNDLGAIWKRWVHANRKVYNIAVAYLNENQGYEKVGKAGGKKGFRSALKSLGLIPEWCRELGIAHALDNAIFEAYKAWSDTKREPKFIGKGKNRKPNPNAGKKIAKFRSIRSARQTIQFDPGMFKQGRWAIQQTKHLAPADFVGHAECPWDWPQGTELTYAKGRWFASFPVEVDVQIADTQRVIALDPGVRTFLTGFDGNSFSEFGNGDFNRIARLCVHLDKLKSKHDKAVGRQFKRLRFKLRKAMERVRTRIKNLRSDIHKQVASHLAQTYDVIYLPTFETSKMVVKKIRKLRSKTARNMMNWAFYKFSQTLQHLCNRYGSRLVRVTEEYTSKTCTRCGEVHHRLGSAKVFKCPNCGHTLPRDFNGALGIFLKAMWDTTFVEFVDSDNVVLSIQDV